MHLLIPSGTPLTKSLALFLTSVKISTRSGISLVCPLLPLLHLQLANRTLGDVFNAAPQEVLSALTSAGVTIEHAVDAVFDEAGAELSKDFNLVGNSVAGFALDAASTIEHFLTGDVAQFVDNTVSEAGQFFEGVGQDIENFFTGGDCEIM